VSPRTVENAAKALREGAAELVEAVEQGALSGVRNFRTLTPLG
jgi:hypothetical protein